MKLAGQRVQHDVDALAVVAAITSSAKRRERESMTCGPRGLAR